MSKNQNYNKFTDEQLQEGTYNYPKLNEAAIQNNINQNLAVANNNNNSKLVESQTLSDYLGVNNANNNNNNNNQIAAMPKPNLPAPPSQYTAYQQYPPQPQQPVGYQQGPLVIYQQQPPYPSPYNQQVIQYAVNVENRRPQQIGNNENSYEELEIDSRDSINIKCPSCSLMISTIVKHKVGLGTNCTALLMGAACCLCFIPYIIKDCQDVVHYCPLCGARVGVSPFLC